jgi:hypothetical protein
MGPDELDDLLASIRAEAKNESALALYEGTREEDLVSEDVDERVLRILGLDEVFDIDYGTYLTLLREKLAEARMVDRKISTEESMLLTDEFKRVRGNVGRFRIRRKKITSENLGVTGPIRVSTEKFYLTSKAVIPQPATPVTESSEDIKDISEAIDKILKSLTDQNKLTKKKADEERKSDEQRRRTKRESELEKPIQKAVALVKKIVAPFQSILDRIMRFIQFTLLGYFVDKVLKWFADPENARKIKVLGRFLKDWWPALLTAYGLFATPFGLFVRSTLKLLRGFIPQMARFMLAHPYLFGAALMTTAGVVGIQQRKQKEEILFPEKDKEGKPIEKTTQQRVSEIQQKGLIQIGDTMGAGPIGGTFSGGGRVRRKSFFGGNRDVNVRDIAFDGGGGISDDSGLRITGAGPDTQLIAAQPGEVMISKKAVDKYGANFFLGLNKRAGGTNIPRMVNNIQLAQGGGKVKGNISGLQGGGMVGGFGNLLNRLGSMGLPGTGRVIAPRGSQMGFQNKLLGIPLNRTTINQQAGQRISPKSVQRYNQSSSAPSVIKPWSPYDSTQVSFPKSVSRPQSSGSLNLNLKQNIQTIQGAAQRQEKMMRQMGVEPSGYVNLRGQPINLGPQSRSMAPGTPVISSKTQMIVLPPTTSVAQKPTTPTISGTQIPEFSIVANTGHRSMISDALGIADLVGA